MVRSAPPNQTEEMIMTEDEALIAFARATLEILETDREWNSDTISRIEQAAYACDVATVNDDSYFVRTGS